MLQIKDIRKEYKTGSLVQKALDGVTVNLRDNEFVAILGPSGSGKTTLLNIIGGLDRYDSGDLIINGVSTKKYKDRDWDSYRNHTIGFVFQSYNLISHQTVLANVELALTISGISGAERRKRAIAALEKVGLGEQLHKKPNQMSGGQMQRVAIARALVNDPDIVLADEPTGALDSVTSVQVMELLKEVAKDRLVIMVTHNPELAEEYATRIVSIKDGKMVSDTNPYLPDETNLAPPVHKNLGKASMSFLTALSLSFNNLRTKKARTILVAIAGSIGIIGIALILSLSTGVNRYIDQQEEATLSQYPLQIQKTGFDLTSLLTEMQSASETKEEEDISTVSSESLQSDSVGVESKQMVGVFQTITGMFSNISSNDLASLKTHLDSNSDKVMTYANSVEYIYDVSPQIYLSNDKGYTKVSPSDTGSSMGLSSMSLMSTSMNMDVFHALPESRELYDDQYDIKAGHWPTNYDECVVVLTRNGNVSDLMLYSLGFRDKKDLDQMISEFRKGNNVDVPEADEEFSYEDFLGVQYKLVNSFDYYTYDKDYKVWTDHSDNKTYMTDLVKKGHDLTIVGVVQPKEDVKIAMLTSGIAYPYELKLQVMSDAADSEIVKAQLADPSTNVFTGNTFDEDNQANAFDMEKMFNVDADALQKAFSVDTSNLNMDTGSLASSMSGIDFSGMDMGSMIDANALSSALPSMSEDQIADLIRSVKITGTQEDAQKLFQQLLDGFNAYASADPSTDYSKLGESLRTYLDSDGAREILAGQIQGILEANSDVLITTDELTSMLTEIMAGYPAYAEANGLDPANMQANMQQYLSDPEGGANQLAAAVSRIRESLTSIEITPEQMQNMTSALSSGYDAYAQENNMPQIGLLNDSFQKYMATEEAQQLLMTGASDMVDTSELTTKISEQMGSTMSTIAETLGSQISGAISQIMGAVAGQLQSSMSQAMASMGSGFADMFQIDTDAFAKAIQMNMTPEQLQELMASLMSGSSTSYENNLTTLGYADPAEPIEIDIYPKNFEAKNSIVTMLDDYNKEMKDSQQDEKVITYTDMVAAMMSSVTDIINTISYVLIAFVAISLVVSSIMIGVITYISVLERRKEIGILRAIGASKHNITQVFNAETFITGLLAGLIGVVTTLLLLIPANMLIRYLAPNTEVHAALPAGAAGILVLLSIILTLVAGLIPSHKAAKSDPVTALRTE